MTSHTRRTILLAVVLVLAGSLALATAASVVDGPADTLADDRVVVQPAAGTDYAYLNDDDEIVVDISATNPNLDGERVGVNTNAVTRFDGLFTVTYTGTTADEGFVEGDAMDLWIDHDVDHLTFTVDGEPVEGRDDSVTVLPERSVTVGIAVDTTDSGSVSGTVHEDDFGIHLATPPIPDEDEPDTSSASSAGSGGASTTVTAPAVDERRFTARDVTSGESVPFDAGGMHLEGANLTLDRMTVTGAPGGAFALDAAGSPDPFDRAGSVDAPPGAVAAAYMALAYDFDPDGVDGLTVGFSADARYLADRGIDPDAVTLLRATDDGGWEELDASVVAPADAAARGLPDDRVHFEATTEDLSVFAVAVHGPAFDVTAASTADDEVDAGAEATVHATVENVGGAAGNGTVTATADGDAIGTGEASLAPGASTEASVPVTFDAPGEYTVAVDGTPAGTVTVLDPAADSAVDGDDGADDGTDDAAASIGDGGADGGDGDGGAVEDGATDEAALPADPVAEPGGFGLAELGGLLALLLVVVASIALARRAPWP
ncbi:DUF1102 domain-containing protein [Halorubrum sp. JWXQ-INN 858]|uniref:CARDB domain-containing protein n=1 Tax=Halorubrum sp. JWXQ-INN 858 TaxID=2690782 RepID=UPI0013589744|nr:CARDB domain-containing protein [Halorubrum sp. JWXQ-INN 858]MWV65729.1 DUF1102 domain-containing protein [Halorubrum sp. JWXQ-INN 858]